MNENNKLAEAIQALAESQRESTERITASIEALTGAVRKLGSIDDFKGAADILAEAIERRLNSN